MFYEMSFNKIIEKYELRRQSLLLCDKKKKPRHSWGFISQVKIELYMRYLLIIRRNMRQ